MSSPLSIAGRMNFIVKQNMGCTRVRLLRVVHAAIVNQQFELLNESSEMLAPDSHIDIFSVACQQPVLRRCWSPRGAPAVQICCDGKTMQTQI